LSSAFGPLKQHHGLGKARYLGLDRNKTRAQLIAMSHNLKTAMNIFKKCLGYKTPFEVNVRKLEVVHL